MAATLTAGLAGSAVTRRRPDQPNDQGWARERERGRADHPALRWLRASLSCTGCRAERRFPRVAQLIGTTQREGRPERRTPPRNWTATVPDGCRKGRAGRLTVLVYCRAMPA